MNKKIIASVLVVGFLMISFVSANWFTNLFNGSPDPEDEGEVLFSPESFGLKDLSDGVQLEKGWNYWYTWSDETLSIKDAVANLENLKYVYAYDSDWNYLGYWYPGKDNSKYNEFESGSNYALYMNNAEEWKYVKDVTPPVITIPKYDKINSSGNLTSVSLEISTNEKAICRYSTIEKSSGMMVFFETGLLKILNFLCLKFVEKIQF